MKTAKHEESMIGRFAEEGFYDTENPSVTLPVLKLIVKSGTVTHSVSS